MINLIEQGEFEAYINTISEKYSPILLMGQYTIKPAYEKEEMEINGAIMQCRYNYPYLNVTIEYGDKALKMFKDKEDMIPYVLHELCHPITDPFYSKAVSRYVSTREILDERERLTDYICNIVIKNNL